jgi:hypothetical protein
MATKKLYERIAAQLRDEYDGLMPLLSIAQRHSFRMMIEKIADVLADDNPRFDRDWFILASTGHVTAELDRT